ncbi:MAG: ABC transporter ATP-binding protein [Chitinophagales bacterium]|nr:ABC transporter ATP-binding protein [Chitinophagales bacterium]
MSDIAISVANVSKMYRLGEVGTGTISHDLNRWWHKVTGKEDPYLKLGEANRRDARGDSNYVWALRDVSFDVRQGEVLGIIGKNGAGKSTLLKLLSRITAPTTGIIKAKGRIASLLEVGTGFHPELTGRENIFLNGAILGMTKTEIKAKFDEIVDFSGVARYIDTPVKRYSSGMYVRLAFAVAAFLEPEILIVDEVLAVGDAEFQKKCLGRMKDVSVNDGRTVLFVSHNMSAVQTLCNRVVVMNDGKVSFEGGVSAGVGKYLEVYSQSLRKRTWSMEEAPGNEHVKILEAIVRPAGGTDADPILINDMIELFFKIYIEDDNDAILDVTFHLKDELGHLVFVSGTAEDDQSLEYRKGVVEVCAHIPKGLMHHGNYLVEWVLVVQNRGSVLYGMENILQFEIVDTGSDKLGWMGAKEGVVKPRLKWTNSRS